MPPSMRPSQRTLERDLATPVVVQVALRIRQQMLIEHHAHPGSLRFSNALEVRPEPLRRLWDRWNERVAGTRRGRFDVTECSQEKTERERRYKAARLPRSHAR